MRWSFYRFWTPKTQTKLSNKNLVSINKEKDWEMSERDKTKFTANKKKIEKLENNFFRKENFYMNGLTLSVY